MATTTLSQQQLDTINGITPRGLMLNSGKPCECGAEHYSTRSELQYSDTMVYYHTCGECGRQFSTWTEG